ncbi:hypothetical protein ARMSODRAFT_205648 [Armillaria solidipes]|uniref:Uncharacterized protein n=1 Tax=Armillaria solidipes TaxID=1076256 RepID=A0A2H3BXB7_9AGAR|nr:hypothetical protein ARMSODRAFT_205648 [Armillaria solidipes]
MWLLHPESASHDDKSKAVRAVSFATKANASSVPSFAMFAWDPLFRALPFHFFHCFSFEVDPSFPDPSSQSATICPRLPQPKHVTFGLYFFLWNRAASAVSPLEVLSFCRISS